MLPTLRAIAALLISYGTLLLANGLFSTLLSVRTKIEHFDTQIAGLILASYYLGLFVGARYGVRIVARVGHIRAFAAFASIISITALVHVLMINVFAWSALRFIAGFCMAGMIMVTESWLNERSTRTTRGKVLSLYMITNYAAAGLAQFLLLLSNPAHFQLFSVVSILYSLALVPVLMTRAAAPQPVQPTAAPLAELYRISPVGMVGALCTGLISASFYSLAPIFTREIGLALSETASFMACGILGGLLLQWPLGWLSDQIDRRWVVILSAVGTAVGCGLIVWRAEYGGPWLYVACVLYGSFAFTIYSHSAAHANDLAGTGRLIQVSSGLLIVYGVGAVLGPLLAAQVMGWIGPVGVFVFNAVVALVLAAFTAWRLRRQVRPGREKRPFVPVPSTQYSSAEIYRAARDQRDRDAAHLLGGGHHDSRG